VSTTLAKLALVGTGVLLLGCSFLFGRQWLVMRGADGGAGAGFGMVAVFYLWIFAFAMFVVAGEVWLWLRRRERIACRLAGHGRGILILPSVLVFAGLIVLAIPFVRAARQSRNIAEATLVEVLRKNGIEPPIWRGLEPEITFKGFVTDYVYKWSEDEATSAVYIRTDVFLKAHVIGTDNLTYVTPPSEGVGSPPGPEL